MKQNTRNRTYIAIRIHEHNNKNTQFTKLNSIYCPIWVKLRAVQEVWSYYRSTSVNLAKFYQGRPRFLIAVNWIILHMRRAACDMHHANNTLCRSRISPFVILWEPSPTVVQPVICTMRTTLCAGHGFHQL